jgi:diguanylate cyclase (GGDEF)-like protein/PAS domain S-box-containing protein
VDKDSPKASSPQPGAPSFEHEIIEKMSEGVGLVRCSDVKILYGNPAVAKMFGYNRTEGLGSHVSNYFAAADKTPEQTVAEIIEELTAHGAWSGEVQNTRKDGSRFWSRLSISTLVHPEHGPVWLCVLEDITARKRTEEELREANRRLEEMAYTDIMTGLPNRRCFIDALSRDLHRIWRYGGRLAIAMLDVDHFKDINDAHGHLVGDRVMVELGAMLHKEIREADLVARFGGDEFVILMPETSLEAAVGAMERLRGKATALAVQGGHGPLRLTFSAGVSAAEGARNVSVIDLLHWADLALYAAKDAGRNCVRTGPFRPMEPAPELPPVEK